MKDIRIKDNSNPKHSFKVAYFDESKRKTLPHKHKNYLEIVILFEASGSHIIDTKNYPVNQPMAFILRRGQIHNWELDEGINGLVFIIKNEYIKKRSDHRLKILLDSLTTSQGLVLKTISPLKEIGKLLIEEYDNPTYNDDYKDGLLKAFLAVLLSNRKELKSDKSGSNPYYISFVELLEEQQPYYRKVNDLASQLNTSPQNLTVICKKESGKTAVELVAEHVLNEAVRLLYYSELTIAEIAHHLGFNDDSHFIKFFKRYKHKTPNQYRLYQD